MEVLYKHVGRVGLETNAVYPSSVRILPENVIQESGKYTVAIVHHLSIY